MPLSREPAVTLEITPRLDLHTLGTIDLRRAGEQMRPVLAQPKRFALFVYLAARRARGFTRRDSILPLFWPEHDESRARTSLRQSLRFLRTALGDDVFERRGDDEIRVADTVAFDADAFAAAVRDGKLEEALDLYRGDFLAGFFVAGNGPEFDQWLEDERATLRETAMRSAMSLAAKLEQRSDPVTAARWVRRAVSLNPHDEAAQRRLIALLDAAGDRAGALHAYESFARRLEREMEVRPSKATQILAAEIRQRPEKLAIVSSGPAASARTTAPTSIVVAPFGYQGPPEDAHLGEALAEEIRSALRSIHGVHVASRLESDARHASHRTGPVLSGDVIREGSRVRITARLMDAGDRRELWSDSYVREMTDVFALQERLARAIAGALRITLAAETTAPLVRRPTNDLSAYNLYLRGRYHWNRRPRETLKGLEFFERAIAIDPLFALAHAGIADVYNTLGSWEAAQLPSWDAFPKAHAAAMKALEIDPTLAEAHTPLAYAEVHYLWRWDEAEKTFRRALALDPSYVHAHHWHSHFLMAQGRTSESLDASRRALEIDPLDLIINVHLAWHYWLAREQDAAIDQAARTAELEERNPWSPFFAGLAHAAQGDFANAIARHRDAIPLSGESTVMRAALGYSLAAGGERSKAMEVVRGLEAIADTKPVSAYEIAVIHNALGETDQAFQWLDRAYEERSAWLAYLAVDPRLDGLRRDERFVALLRGVGLEQTLLGGGNGRPR